MTEIERQLEQEQALAYREIDEESTLLDLSLTSIPIVGIVYQSLKEWQTRCAPRVYPQTEFTHVREVGSETGAANEHRHQASEERAFRFSSSDPMPPN